jgi:hypothetical protein
MTPEDHRRAGDLFAQVLELPEDERAAFLDSACTENPELRRQVLRLFDADRAAAGDSFLQRGGIEDAARLLTATPPDLPPPGTVLGSYRLGARIGAGGMGTVYEAQDLRLGRRVAVKILSLPFAAERTELIQRF